MFQALLHIPVKILLSIAGALFTLNFATYFTQHYPRQADDPVIAESVHKCDSQTKRHVHRHIRVEQLPELEVERARIMALRGLELETELESELHELKSKIEVLRMQENGREIRIEIN